MSVPPLGEAFDAVRVSVDRFCLLAGIEALQELMEEDVRATQLGYFVISFVIKLLRTPL